jgi:hypothetical protein
MESESHLIGVHLKDVKYVGHSFKRKNRNKKKKKKKKNITIIAQTTIVQFWMSMNFRRETQCEVAILGSSFCIKDCRIHTKCLL